MVSPENLGVFHFVADCSIDSSRGWADRQRTKIVAGNSLACAIPEGSSQQEPLQRHDYWQDSM
jgi:hypothetical protein